eukprot:gene1065-400_t
MFVPMLKAACAYIDIHVQEYMLTPLPSTGFPPDWRQIYLIGNAVIGDKSTNHRITNQVSMLCTVVDGQREAIAINARPVYTDSSGKGDSASKLAQKILCHIEQYAGIEGKHILFMSGKVTDGQHLIGRFADTLNEALWKHLPFKLWDEKWWPLQWDPSHGMDKIFKKFEEEEFVFRLLSRTKVLHILFGHGKLHSIAKETTKEVNLPFRVTIPFAKQRFLSSSYK